MTLMYYGLRVTSFRLSKRLRDGVFTSLIRQEVGFFNTLDISALVSQLQDDVIMV